MQICDWNSRWEQNLIGFHEGEANRYLTQYFSAYNLPEKAAVFVPLCGKSHDLAWLAKQGLQVYGIECSELAIKSFFEEHNIDFQVTQKKPFTLYCSDNITLLQGDFFALSHDHLPNIDFIYDRASLVAFDSQNQTKYLNHLAHFFNPQTQLLLITLHYDQSTMQGPPFSVDNEELIKFYRSKNIQLLEQNNVVDETPRWRQVGLTSLLETAYKATP